MTAWTGVAGKRVLITGATDGIGLAAAAALAAKGAKLALTARSEEKARAAVEKIKSAGGGKADIDVLSADLSSMASVRRCAAEALSRYPRIDILVNNAGAMHPKRALTPEGFERTWAVNHLSVFLLTELLLDRLKASAPARIITTSSGAHRRAGAIPFEDMSAERCYREFLRYSETKLANVLFTRELANRLEGTGVAAACFHPGTVATGFGRDSTGLMRLGLMIARPFFRTPEKGAETLLWLCETPELKSGGYYLDLKEARVSAAGQDDAAARRLWDVSAEQVARAT